ncbi:MAG TPA: hypothetical protein VE978_07115 [Chitinophagales bacterium]|nr:hypothetical protein [Chitinophagales bacterium]
MAQIGTEDFIRFLKSKGLVYKRTKGSHDIYDFPEGEKQLPRPVVIRGIYKEIPDDHITTNLNTLGSTKKELKEFLEKKH